jgi:RNA polymerase sigma-70 factor, ECF subfamily
MKTREGHTISAPELDAPALAGSTIDANLATFVATNYDRLIRLAVLVCHDPTNAADAVQSALEQAWRRRDSLRDETRLKPWLDRIVVREAIRRGKPRTSMLDRLIGRHPTVDWIEPAGDDRARLDLRDALRDAFRQLTADQRAVVILHLHLGYSIAEVADLVGAPHETVRSRLRLARGRLRQALQETER